MKAAQSAKNKQQKKLMKSAGATLGILACLVLCVVLVANGYLNKMNFKNGPDELRTNIGGETDGGSNSPEDDIARLEQMLKEQGENSTPPMFDKDVLNVLLVGTDTRDQIERGRSDSMILISLNKKTSKIIATSFLRDCYVSIPGFSQGDRLNAAYAYGGSTLLFQTLEQNFKIKVDKFVAVDFFAFIDIIDELGGISLNLSESEVRVANTYVKEINKLAGMPETDGYLTHAGEQVVSGKQALGFARNRYIGDGDFSRTDRQRIVLEKIFEKAKTMRILDMKRLIDKLLPQITTNLPKSEIFSLLLSAPSYLKYSIDSWHVPNGSNFSYMTVRGMSVINVDFPAAIEELQRRIYG